MKHTKGPWKVSKSTMEYKDMGGKKYINRLITHGSTWADTDDIDKIEKTPILAEVSGFERTLQERDANARLIASAPEMLEALKAVMGVLSQNKTFPADIAYIKRFCGDIINQIEGEE